MQRQLTSKSAGAVALLSLTATAAAVPTFVQSQETPHCDVLMPLSFVDELGRPNVFPAGERIDSVFGQTTLSACPSHDDPTIPNVTVAITNLNTFTFFDLHYVADPMNAAGLPGTSIGNEDGLVNAGQAFRIDNVGVNKPLLSESINPNLLFEPGEVWRFIIDDYVNTAGLGADAFFSIGVGAASPGGPSSGSIIALIPEPASLGLAALALPALLRRRRGA